ncbi:MAG: hypothetical protein JNJ80_23510 [Gemmatimonadetes bacterium]|nr:hypothetical protein [Gemmatimonadota bacterium]
MLGGSMDSGSKQPRKDLTDAFDAVVSDSKHARRSSSDGEDRAASGSGESLAAAYQALMTTYTGASPATPRPGSAEPVQATPTPGNKEQLLAAYDQLVEYEASKPKVAEAALAVEARKRGWKRFVQPAIIAACLAGMGYIWFGKPAWLYPPFDPIAPPANELQASRQLIAASILVAGHQERLGRLPTTLEELGIALPGTTIFNPGDGSYQLMTTFGRRSLLLNAAPGRVPVIERPTP